MRSITKTIDYANEKKQLETEYKNKQLGSKKAHTHSHTYQSVKSTIGKFNWKGLSASNRVVLANRDNW